MEHSSVPKRSKVFQNVLDGDTKRNTRTLAEHSSVPKKSEQLPLIRAKRRSNGTLERSKSSFPIERGGRASAFRRRPGPQPDVPLGCDACGRINPQPAWRAATRPEDPKLRCPACHVVGQASTDVWTDEEASG